jgi:hypothetical protein
VNGLDFNGMVCIPHGKSILSDWIMCEWPRVSSRWEILVRKVTGSCVNNLDFDEMSCLLHGKVTVSH